MYRLYSIVLVLFFSSCSHFTFNATMCDQIASDPQVTMPEECRNYNEDEAQKAFDNTKHDRKESSDDIVEFNQKDKEDK